MKKRTYQEGVQSAWRGGAGANAPDRDGEGQTLIRGPNGQTRKKKRTWGLQKGNWGGGKVPYSKKGDDDLSKSKPFLMEVEFEKEASGTTGEVAQTSRFFLRLG